MPSDHPLLLMKFDPDKNGWKEYYQYLKTELQKDSEKHYYTNLEWINISSIIKAKDFNDAPVDIRKEIWK